MRNIRRSFLIAAVPMVAVVFLIAGSAARSSTQGPGTTATKQKPMHIQAQAMGQRNNWGKPSA